MCNSRNIISIETRRDLRQLAEAGLVSASDVELAISQDECLSMLLLEPTEDSDPAWLVPLTFGVLAAVVSLPFIAAIWLMFGVD